MSAARCGLLLMSGAPTPAAPADRPLQRPGWDLSNSPSLQNAAYIVYGETSRHPAPFRDIRLQLSAHRYPKVHSKYCALVRRFARCDDVRQGESLSYQPELSLINASD
ncbi:hypothetical protein V496_03611 [Pseudogymnoascus sp. VKM F-4515 (FW-2607)]|nr:hypothetical protein V496_03611 [Pseudogymnoascus sp. VKM F-4515 (FW-2607)]